MNRLNFDLLFRRLLESAVNGLFSISLVETIAVTASFLKPSSSAIDTQDYNDKFTHLHFSETLDQDDILDILDTKFFLENIDVRLCGLIAILVLNLLATL